MSHSCRPSNKANISLDACGLVTVCAEHQVQAQNCSPATHKAARAPFSACIWCSAHCNHTTARRHSDSIALIRRPAAARHWVYALTCPEHQMAGVLPCHVLCVSSLLVTHTCFFASNTTASLTHHHVNGFVCFTL